MPNDSPTPAAGPGPEPVNANGQADAAAQPPRVNLSVLRPDDLLALDFAFLNFALQTGQAGGPPVLQRVAGQPAFMIVTFPPQHITENAYPQQGGVFEALDDPPVRALLAAPSRLVFQMPDGLQSIPLTLEDLLAWARYALNVPDNALPDGIADPNGPAPAPPAANQTVIEIPFDLFLSPSAEGGWVHATQAVTHDSWTELWHTRLAFRSPDGSIDETQGMPAVRAIWAVDMGQRLQEDLNLTIPRAQDRIAIVEASSDFSLKMGPPDQPDQFPYQPAALQVSRLMLSSLGAWLSANGAWDPGPSGLVFPQQLTVQSWRHIASMGRDQYVRVVRGGYLYPFGHRAALVETSERVPAPSPDGTGQAEYLGLRTYIVIQEPVRDFAAQSSAYPAAGREMPLRWMRIKDLTTPDLSGDPAGVFVPSLDGTPYEFHFEAEDWDGQRVDFTAAQVFVPASVSGQVDQNLVVAAAALYTDALRSCDLRGQALAIAENLPDDPRFKPGATRFPTQRLLFKVEATPTSPPFLPAFDRAEVNIPAIGHLLGSSGAASAASIALHGAYLDHGLGSPDNAHDVFAALADGALGVKLPVDKAGGLARPSVQINGLSRTLGAVPAVDNLVQNTPFDPRSMFDPSDRLLGAISLGDIVAQAIGPDAVPKFRSTHTADSVDTSFEWDPPVQVLNDPSAIPLVTTGATKLHIAAHTHSRLDGGDAQFTVDGLLSDFQLNFLNMVAISFEQLAFHTERGSKVDLNVKGIDVEFVGPLQFLNLLAKIIPAGGLSDPPALAVSPTGILAGYSIGIPSAGVGIFSLENVAVGVSLRLPFTDDPIGLRLSFSERYHPFLVTVSLIGGGGFLAVDLDAHGVKQIEGSLEVGANLSIDLVIVSANAHIMAGFYFHYDGSGVNVAGYLRVGASVELFGLAGISVDFYMDLHYSSEPSPGSIGGRASVTVGVHLLMFTKHITLSVEKNFPVPSSGNDPTFDQVMDVNDWEEYCRAFA